MYDIIVVGSGFVGSTIAYLAAKSGKNVLLIEKRNHIAGNMFDEKQEGILVHRYGPHIFHTNDEDVYRFVNSFGEWIPFELRCRVFMDGKLTPSPFNFKTIDDFYSEHEAEDIKRRLINYYNGSPQAVVLDMLSCNDKVIRSYAEFLFEKDYLPYTCKQWGISPDELDKSVLARVPVVFSYKDRYFSDKYQIMPKNGYTEIIRNMLEHPNIKIKLNTDAAERFALFNGNITFDAIKLNIPLIYTGPLDEFFNYRYGKLPYRSLYFEYKVIEQDSYQEAAVVSYPQEPSFTRITEYSKLPPQNGNGKTVIAVEYPEQYTRGKKNEPYYPIPCESSKTIYEKYITEAKKYKNFYPCGRLADYKYYNMDQAINRAFDVWQKISNNIISKGTLLL